MQFESIFPLVIVFVVVAILFLRGSEERSKLSTLAARFNGIITKFSFYPQMSAEYHGLKFLIRLIPAGKSSPPCLEIILLKNSSFKLKIYRENFLSNFGEKLHLIHEVKINDEKFDSEFMIFSNNQQQAVSRLRNESAKNMVRELFGCGFNYIIITGKSITIGKPDYGLESDVNHDSVTNVLRKLISFSSGI
ncbi:MAG: hypothetical protein PHP17_04190 [Candidatus Omnitrophica bacterium]|nr:hypothetical protein [Candidatus Omnitrophota bacterium]